ncbi:hypothetical protein OQA88_4765 [Cercophora sp. LCS_1]
MVSFFGLKFGDKKKKSERSPEAVQQQWKRTDQNKLGGGQLSGQGTKETSVANGAARSFPRPDTAQSTRTPYTYDTHNLAAASMFNLSAGNHGRAGSRASLKPHASEANIRGRFGANNGSSTSLALPSPAFGGRYKAQNGSSSSLGVPGPGFSSRLTARNGSAVSLALPGAGPGPRPGTSNGRAKEWVNPLDVHFMRQNPASPPVPKSPLLQSPQLPPTPKAESDNGSVFGAEADDMVDSIIAAVKSQENEANEQQRESAKAKETARLERERQERQRATETKTLANPPPPLRTPSQPQSDKEAQSPSEIQHQTQLRPPRPRPSPESGPPSAGANTQGPIFRGNVDDRPGSRNGMVFRETPEERPASRGHFRGNPDERPGSRGHFRGNNPDERPGSRGGMRNGPTGSNGSNNSNSSNGTSGAGPRGPSPKNSGPNPGRGRPNGGRPEPLMGRADRKPDNMGEMKAIRPRNGPNGPDHHDMALLPKACRVLQPMPVTAAVLRVPVLRDLADHPDHLDPTGLQGLVGQAGQTVPAQTEGSCRQLVLALPVKPTIQTPPSQMVHVSAARTPVPNAPRARVLTGLARGPVRSKSSAFKRLVITVSKVPLIGQRVLPRPAFDASNPYVSGISETRSESPAPSLKGLGVPRRQQSGSSVQSPAANEPTLRELMAQSPEPMSPGTTSRSSDGGAVIEQFARPVIQSVQARRDTFTLNSPRRHSLSMEIEELEKSLVKAQQSQVQEAARASVSSSHYSDESDDGPIEELQPAPLRSSPQLISPIEMATSPLEISRSTQREQSPMRGPLALRRGPRRPTLDEYGVPSSKLSNNAYRRDPTGGSISPLSRSTTPLFHQQPNRDLSTTPTLDGLDPPPPRGLVQTPTTIIEAGFKFDFGPTIAPPTPDSTTWPLPSPPSPAQQGDIETGANAESTRARPNPPPPLDLNFNFSPDAYSRDPGLWTPPLKAPGREVASNDERPSTAQDVRMLAPPLTPVFGPSKTPVDDDAAATALALGIGVARGPSVRFPQGRKPNGMVDEFGTGFI